VSDISEALRKQQGDHQVADEQNADDDADDVVDAHSRSTAFTISAAKAKNRLTMRRKIRSAIAVLHIVRCHELSQTRGTPGGAAANAALTRPLPVITRR
jgi:hypothetical protein